MKFKLLVNDFLIRSLFAILLFLFFSIDSYAIHVFTFTTTELSIEKVLDGYEPASNGTFKVRLPAGMAAKAPVMIYYSVSGTATAGVDYNTLPGFVKISAGQNEATIQVNVVDDDIIEGDETIIVTLTSATVVNVGTVPINPAYKQATMIIGDDDLMVTKFEAWKLATLPTGNKEVKAGEYINYTIYVRNTGNGVIPQITITDAVPDHTDYVSGGTLNRNNAEFIINDLQPGAIREVSFKVMTPKNLSGVTEIRNTAHVSDGVTTTPTYACDPQTSACDTVTIVPVSNKMGDLAITKTPVVINGPYVVGQMITYNIVVQNIGEAICTNVVAVDSLPAGLDLPVDYSTSKGTIDVNTITRQLTCTIDELQPGETMKIALTCKILIANGVANVAYVSAGEEEQTLYNNRMDSWVPTYAKGLYIVNAFTPGKGVNHKFAVVGIEKYPGSKLQVFNRWGSLVYQSANYQNDWTAENLPMGVYLYVIDIKQPEGIVNYKGTVFLLK